MKLFLRVAVVLSLGSVSGLAAQEVEERPAVATTEEPPAEKNLNFLPKPLPFVRCNILSLERTGYFRIESVEYRARGDLEAFVWTVRVEKAVTCRHIEALLREYRDVRFYETISKRPIEILAGLVHYSQRISLGSSDNLLLGQDDVFELWIDLTNVELRKLRAQRADKLVLRRWRY